MTSRTELSEMAADRNTDPQTSRRGMSRAVVALLLLVLLAGAAFGLKGTGVLHALRSLLPHAAAPEIKEPLPRQILTMLDMTPADTSTGVDPKAPIVVTLSTPNGPIDPRSVSDDSIGLFRFDTRERVPMKVTLQGNKLIATPLQPLEPSRNYRIELPPGLIDVTGGKLRQTTRSFFTSEKPPAGVAFDRVEMPAAKGDGYTCLVFGPDGKFWASTHAGKLIRFDVGDDGILANPTTYSTILAQEHGPRLVTGFTFGPESTPEAPVIYVLHSEFGFGIDKAVTDFTSKLSRISGDKFDKLEDLIVNLPRSARDHNVNQAKFGPDGAFYIPQPSNSAVGGPDAYWYNREEHLLTASILRVDIRLLPQGKPFDARTIDVGGTFDPYAAGSPITIYATGLRMPYDLLWHSNGRLYSAINGASSRGATPAGTDKFGTSVPAVASVSLAEHDWLFDIEKDHYYGHPNPAQKHFVLNGGNPTATPDFNEVADYPVGVMPDPEWTPAIYDFGQHTSSNGLLEYKSDTFGGALKGKILVCRYNIGSDILVVGLSPDGKLVESTFADVPGFEEWPTAEGKPQKLLGPLDIVEDERNGNLYVIEYYESRPADTRITLLRPRKSSAAGQSASAR